jgi:peptide-methionine (S)-S-oxide reductase
VKNPTYQQVCEESTGHAEVVQVVFDPKKASFDTVLGWFWKLHDPTTLNRQGADQGTQYRSAIFFSTDAQKTAAEESKKKAQADFSDPIVTEITKATQFWPAENYHQDYYFQNKNKNGYCRAVIEPKLKKLKLDH